MGTGENIDHRTSKRSVAGSILASLLLAGLVAMALELVAMASAAPNSAAHALARSAEGLVALERQLGRSGTLVGYHIQF
jgi:hypothetical protein